jgi:hypothetical protein
MDYEPSWAEHDANARDARRRLEQASRVAGADATPQRFARLRQCLFCLRAVGRVRVMADATVAQPDSPGRL